MVMPAPEHGSERGWRLERDAPAGMTFAIGPNGETFELTLPPTQEVSVVEKFCAHCGTWTTVRGVTGALRWMAEHDGGCSPTSEKRVLTQIAKEPR